MKTRNEEEQSACTLVGILRLKSRIFDGVCRRFDLHEKLPTRLLLHVLVSARLAELIVQTTGAEIRRDNFYLFHSFYTACRFLSFRL